MTCKALEALTELLTATEPLLKSFDNWCRVDHHGQCQSHLLDKPCSVVRARRAFTQAHTAIRDHQFEPEWRSQCCGAPPHEASPDVGADNPVGLCGKCRENTGFERADHRGCDGGCGTECPCYQKGYQKGQYPFAGREIGSRGTASEEPREEAPDSIRFGLASHFTFQGGTEIQTAIYQENARKVSWLILEPAKKPYREGAPKWRCECGISGTAPSLFRIWQDARLHFWHNHAEKVAI